MASILTDHVRDFGPDSDPEARVLPEIGRLLRQRMRRKNLLLAPPSYLGYHGVANWQGAGAFDDITVDCYIYAVLARIEGLRNQLRARPNIDGLIVRNVDNFLLERQRRHDPVGYAIFQNVAGAVRAEAVMGHLAVEGATDGRLHSSSVLRLDPSQLDAQAVDRLQIEQALIQVLETAKVPQGLISVSEEGQEWAQNFLVRLREIGVAAVRCGDVVAVAAARAREDRPLPRAAPDQRFAFEGDEDYTALVRMVWPDQALEHRDNWEALKRQIADRIAGLNRQQRVRERLLSVFEGLVQAIEEGPASPPSQAELVERLGIPRATLSDDFRLLGEIISSLIEKNPE
jgi:hypothetical protein